MNKELQQIVKTIKKIAKDNEINAQYVTKTMLVSEGVSDWVLRKCGGLKGILDTHFPQQDKDLQSISEIKKDKGYIASLEKRLGEKLNVEELVKESFKSLVIPKVKKHKKTKFKSTDELTHVVGMLNDTHVGLIVDPEEIGNGNSFDFKEASRRFAFYGQQLAKYKIHKRKNVEKLHLILNGDMIAGLIHSLDTKTVHLMIHQVNGALHILTNLVSYLNEYYPTIAISGIAGNHCRGVHKNHGQRAVAEVYDNYANIIYYGLSTAFRNNPNISFNFPKTPYGFFQLPQGRAMHAHGDHIFSKSLGNPGSSVNVKGLTNSIRDFNAGEIEKGNAPVKLVLFSHVHAFAHFITNDGVEVYISPSLVGLDQYAHSLTINNNFIAQPVFESTKDFILGDSRLIRLGKADKDVSLDKIIPLYNKELKWIK